MNRDTRISGGLADMPFMGRQSLYDQDRPIADQRRDGAPAGKNRHGQPEPGAEERLRRALERHGAEGDAQAEAEAEAKPQAESAPDGALGSMLPWTPGLSQPALPSAVAPHESAQQLGEMVGEMVDRLMVDTKGGGRQVRIDLKDGALSGATVVIQESEGRLQVDFVCREEPVRLRLNREADGHAALLAERLGREVLLRVMADDDEFPCIHEVVARP